MMAPIWADLVGAEHHLDIEIAPTLEQQLAALDAADQEGEQAYAVRYLICLAQIGCRAFAVVVDDALQVHISYPADELDRDRQKRVASLREHLDGHGRREAVIALLERQPHSMSWPTDLRRHATAVLRAFLGSGYRCFLTSRAEIGEGGALPAEWFTTPLSGRREAIARAGRDYVRLRRYPYGNQFIARAIRLLGRPHEATGSIILEAAHA